MFMKKMFLLTALLACISFVLPASATTYYVRPDGNDLSDGLSWATAFATVQKGINTTVNGDAVEVNIGDYPEKVNFNGKTITLRGTNPDNWTDVNRTVLTSVTLMTAEGNDTLVEGIRLQGKIPGGYTTGVTCSGTSPTISRCMISGGYAFRGSNGSSATIKNCKIFNALSAGIIAGWNTKITGSEIYRCRVGISCSGNTTITNCVVANSYAYGIWSSLSQNTTITNCIIWNSWQDLNGCTATYSCIQDVDDAEGVGNITANPLFADIDNNDLHLTMSSPCINAGDPYGDYTGQTDIDGEPRVMQGRVDMGADETSYHNGHWWKLDETEGSVAHDCIDGNDGDFSDGLPGWTGTGVDLDGADDYFSVSSLDTAYNPITTFTVAGWFSTSATTGMQTIIGQWNQNGFSPYPGVYITQYFGWQILVENKKVVARFGEGSTSPADITGTSDVNDGEWHHFTLVYPTYNSNAVLYVDGVSEGTPAIKTCAINSTRFRIGDASQTTGINAVPKGGPFNGVLSDVIIFHRALTADEVWNLYIAGQ